MKHASQGLVLDEASSGFVNGAIKSTQTATMLPAVEVEENHEPGAGEGAEMGTASATKHHKDIFYHDPIFWQQIWKVRDYFLEMSADERGRTSYIGALRKYLATFRWKVAQLFKLTFGWWDDSLLDNMEVKELARRLNINKKDNDEYHEEMIQALGEAHSLIWQFLPGCVFIAKAGEAFNSAPVFVYDQTAPTTIQWAETGQRIKTLNGSAKLEAGDIDANTVIARVSAAIENRMSRHSRLVHGESSESAKKQTMVRESILTEASRLVSGRPVGAYFTLKVDVPKEYKRSALDVISRSQPTAHSSTKKHGVASPRKAMLSSITREGRHADLIETMPIPPSANGMLVWFELKPEAAERRAKENEALERMHWLERSYHKTRLAFLSALRTYKNRVTKAIPQDFVLFWDVKSHISLAKVSVEIEVQGELEPIVVFVPLSCLFYVHNGAQLTCLPRLKKNGARFELEEGQPLEVAFEDSDLIDIPRQFRKRVKRTVQEHIGASNGRPMVTAKIVNEPPKKDVIWCKVCPRCCARHLCTPTRCCQDPDTVEELKTKNKQQVAAEKRLRKTLIKEHGQVFLTKPALWEANMTTATYFGKEQYYSDCQYFQNIPTKEAPLWIWSTDCLVQYHIDPEAQKDGQSVADYTLKATFCEQAPISLTRSKTEMMRLWVCHVIQYIMLLLIVFANSPTAFAIWCIVALILIVDELVDFIAELPRPNWSAVEFREGNMARDEEDVEVPLESIFAGYSEDQKKPEGDDADADAAGEVEAGENEGADGATHDQETKVISEPMEV